MKTSSPELSSAGRSIGTVTRPSTRSGDAPTLRAEFSSAESVPASAAWQMRNTTGTATAVPSAAMPGTLARFSGMCRVPVTKSCAYPPGPYSAFQPRMRPSGGSRIGAMNKREYTRRPGTSVRLHRTANPPPRTSEHTVVMAANSSVFSAAVRNAGSVNSCR